MAVVLLPVAVQAAGFALFQQGTGAMAQGNAFVAEANDPSAIFYNPAGITQIKRPTFYNAFVFLYPSREYEGNAFGSGAETNHRFYHSGSVYGVYPVHDKVSLGIGLFNPFGLSTAWPPTWAGRYLTTYSQVRTYNLNPTIAFKLRTTFPWAWGPTSCGPTSGSEANQRVDFAGRELAIRRV